MSRTFSTTNTPDATASIKGKLQLGGDITGTATAPTIKSSVALSGNPTTTTQTSTDNSTKIATTAYVTTGISNAVSGINPAVAVQVATIANVSGYTYNNGVSGIGATLTQNSAAVVTIDGYIPTLNDRVLFKNQSTSANNGVYVITTLGTGIIPAVFTRATDYNQPSDINNTGAIPVVNGTVNALTSWLLTAKVTTIGTDSLTYSQFSYSPTSVIPPNLGGTGIANNSSSTITISGNFGTTLTVSGATSLTLPTSGTVTALGNTTTGSGSIVLATSPTLITPTLGVATATSINKVSITAPATSSTLAIADGKTLTVSNSLTIAGTDSTVMTFPSTSGTVATIAATQTITNKNLSSTTNTFPVGFVVQTAEVTSGAVATGTTTIPNDDTKPQSTEGDQYLVLAITPKSTVNNLVIEVVAFVSNSSAVGIIGSLFQDSGTDAIAAADVRNTASTEVNMLVLRTVIPAGTISSTTFKFRAGGDGAGTTTFNGSGGSRRFGGITLSSMVIWEVQT